MNLENKKQVASQAYALEHFTDVTHLNKIKDAWLDGFETKEGVIEETLDTLMQLREDISKLPLTEQLFKSRDLDRINSKIEVLQSLL